MKTNAQKIYLTVSYCLLFKKQRRMEVKIKNRDSGLIKILLIL
jgi:hypothetical protein